MSKLTLSFPPFKESLNFLLGLAAVFYLGGALVVRGGFAEVPIVLVSLIVVVHSKLSGSKSTNYSKQVLVFANSLLFLGLWGCVTVWFHDGAIDLYEPYAKIIVGSIVAFAFAFSQINFAYIRAGLYLAVLSLLYLYFFEFESSGRFSNNMNPNKWAPLLLSYAISSLALFFLEKSGFLKLIALISSLIFTFFIFLSSSRASFFIVTFFLFVALFFIGYRRNKILSIIVLVFIFSFGAYFISNTDSVIDSKIKNFKVELYQVANDNYMSSLGMRLMMWKTGLDAFSENMLIGAGYDLSENAMYYKPNTNGEADALPVMIKHYGSYHNVWVDTLVSQGLLGLIVLISFFANSIRFIFNSKSLLLIGPLLAVAMNGLSESTMHMSLLVGHLALAGAIYSNPIVLGIRK